MYIKLGLFSNNIQRIYDFWAKNRPELARNVDYLMKKYEQALAQSGKIYYKSQILELSVRQVSLMEQMSEVYFNSDSFKRKSETRVSDIFRIIFQREDEVRAMLISLKLLSIPEDNINEGEKKQ